MTGEPRPSLYSGLPWIPCVGPTADLSAPPTYVCVQCGGSIGEQDRKDVTAGVRLLRGVLTAVVAPVHYECKVRATVGSLAHLLGTGDVTPCPYRMEASRVVAEINAQRRHHGLGPL